MREMGSGCVAAGLRLGVGGWVACRATQLCSTGLCGGARCVGHEYEDNSSRRRVHTIVQGYSLACCGRAQATSQPQKLGDLPPCLGSPTRLAMFGCFAWLLEGSLALAQGTQERARGAKTSGRNAPDASAVFCSCLEMPKASKVFNDDKQWEVTRRHSNAWTNAVGARHHQHEEAGGKASKQASVCKTRAAPHLFWNSTASPLRWQLEGSWSGTHKESEKWAKKKDSPVAKRAAAAAPSFSASCERDAFAIPKTTRK